MRQALKLVVPALAILLAGSAFAQTEAPATEAPAAEGAPAATTAPSPTRRAGARRTRHGRRWPGRALHRRRVHRLGPALRADGHGERSVPALPAPARPAGQQRGRDQPLPPARGRTGRGRRHDHHAARDAPDRAASGARRRRTAEALSLHVLLGRGLRGAARACGRRGRGLPPRDQGAGADRTCRRPGSGGDPRCLARRFHGRVPGAEGRDREGGSGGCRGGRRRRRRGTEGGN